LAITDSEITIGNDIKRLINLGALPNLYTTRLKWLPISCAVRYGNESTFNVLVDQKYTAPFDFRNLTDARGWTFLHLAAESGSEALITKLLSSGLDPNAKSDKSSWAMPNKELERLELTPGDIAKSCRHEKVYERSLKVTGHTIADPG